VFGIGADLDEQNWRNVFRQLVVLGLARPDHEAYGALRLTEASRAVLKGEQAVEMRRVSARKLRPAKPRSGTGSEPMGSVDEALFARLKAWRTGEARAQSVPPYVIFHDRTLAAIAARRPQDLAALAAIDGIGAKRLERYGAALLELLHS
jgi:ATP-dependent DNA helicase RecQ